MSTSPPISSTRARLTLLGILFLGLALRIWTIGSGVPHAVEDDEPVIIEKALHMMTSGDLNPHFFDYGGLTMYLHLAVCALRFVVGAMGKQFVSLDSVWAGDFYLWTRTATALLGTLTIYVLYRVAVRWGTTPALVASLMMAVYPLHTRYSHFALTDVPLTFLVALTLLLSLIAAEDGRLRWFVLAGLVAGLATATKYSGALALLMPLIAAATSPSIRFRSAAAVTAAGAMFGGFLLGAPYSLIDLPAFLNSFAALAQHYNQQKSDLEAASLYMKYLRGGFGFGWSGWWTIVGWPATLLSLLGLSRLAFQLFSPARRAAAAIVLIFPIAYFGLIAHQSLVFARYALPLAPMICLGLGLGLTAARSVIAPRRHLACLVIALIAIPPTVQAVSWDVGRLKIGTEELMARWIMQNVPPSEPIVIETPRIQLPPQFHVEHSTRLIARSVDAYRAEGVVYLIGSSELEDVFLRDAAGSSASAYRKLFASTQMVTIIQPTSDHPGPTLTVWKIPR